MGDAGVVQRLVDRLVGVAMLGILADHGDGDLVLRIAQAVEQVAPVIEVQRPGLQAQLADDQLVQAVLDQAHGHFVHGKVLVLLLDDRLDGHVAEQGDLRPVVARQRALAAADEDVGLDADLAQEAHAVLRGLGLQFGGRLQVGDQRKVDVEAIFLAHVERELADRLQEGLAFDVAHRAADLGDDHVHAGAVELGQGGLDLVGDVGNDLDGLAEELAPPLLVDHRKVDLPGRVVRVAVQRRVGEAFVMAQVEVGFAAVVQHVDLAVLVGAHRAGIDVDIGIELLHADGQPALLQQHADRGAGEPFSQRADHAAGHEDMFGHGLPSWLLAVRHASAGATAGLSSSAAARLDQPTVAPCGQKPRGPPQTCILRRAGRSGKGASRRD